MSASSQWPSVWFEYFAQVQPHHTDYAGVVWHGAYLEWMEAARIEVFRAVGLDYADLVKMGCDLPVIELSLRYQQAIPMGKAIVIKSRIRQIRKVRLFWDQHIYCANDVKPRMIGQVTLVPVNTEKGSILRTPPSAFQQAISHIEQFGKPD